MRYFVYITFTCLVISCSECLPYEQNEHSYILDSINGFEVKLDTQLDSESKALIIDIVESMVFVEGECFLMGKNAGRISDMPSHYVRVSDYYICKFELTPQSYNTIMNTNRKYLSRDDWQFFIEYVNNSTGLRFDFPTEAQWEYAAKGGKLTKGYIYSGSNELDKVRCSSLPCSNNCIANELGLLDMSGGVSEWCKDSYAEYDPLYCVDPYVKYGEDYVVRGGSYLSYDETPRFNKEVDAFWCEADFRMCETTSRMRAPKDRTSQTIGCRLVINL